MKQIKALRLRFPPRGRQSDHEERGLDYNTPSSNAYFCFTFDPPRTAASTLKKLAPAPLLLYNATGNGVCLPFAGKPPEARLITPTETITVCR